MYKSRYWFNRYGNFAEWVNYVFWWSGIEEGLGSAGLPSSMPCSLVSPTVAIETGRGVGQPVHVELATVEHPDAHTGGSAGAGINKLDCPGHLSVP